MTVRFLMGLLLCLPVWVKAWEEEQVLAYIMAYNPLIQAHRDVTTTYQPAGTLRRVMEHTALFVRLASGGGESTAEEGSTTRTDPVTAGIQVTIPLASPKETRAYAEKIVTEAAKIDEIGSQALAEMAKLRQYEADFAAAQLQQEFYKTKSQWLQGRVNQGYDEAEVLWDNSQKLNVMTADIMKLKLLIDSQRQQLAQHAGAQWKTLLAYLAGKGPLPASAEPP